MLIVIVVVILITVGAVTYLIVRGDDRAPLSALLLGLAILVLVAVYYNSGGQTLEASSGLEANSELLGGEEQ